MEFEFLIAFIMKFHTENQDLSQSTDLQRSYAHSWEKSSITGCFSLFFTSFIFRVSMTSVTCKFTTHTSQI